MLSSPNAARAAVFAMLCTTAWPLFAQSPSRGELLYSAHCVECHTAQMHWRDKSIVSDWASLQAQVRRWQATAGLAWSEADIAEVARYLNQNVYRIPAPGPQASAAPGR